MSKYNFIHHDKRYPHSFPTGSMLRVHYPEIKRPKKDQPFKGFAVLVEGTGKLKRDEFSVRIVNTNLSGLSGASFWCYAKPDSIKEKVRRIRPEEQAELDAVDEQIRALNERRKELLKKAWAKGHVVTVSELRELAEGGS